MKRSRLVNVRRTRSQMERLREETYNVLSEIQPATVRKTFYQLVSRGIFDKTESEYKHTISGVAKGAGLPSLRRNGCTS